ncbi:MAG: dihydrodipicolinate synthase family protein [Candidatus Sumerlaeota bacterium]
MAVRFSLDGLVAAPFTPFHADGSLNTAAIAQQAEGTRGLLTGVFICGTTGEGISMTVKERMAVAERWLAVRPKDLKVIVHVGASGAADGQVLAAHAQSIGADAISTMGPLGFKPAHVHALVEYCEVVAASAPKLPFFYYHMPSLNGVAVSMMDFVAIAADRIPTFAGVKYTHDDLNEYALLVKQFGAKYNIVFGRDEYLLHALQVGAKGAVGSTYNYMAPIYLSIIAKTAKGDSDGALRDHLRAVEIIQVLIKYGGGVIGGKCIMKLLGLDLGPCRTPLSTPPAQIAAKMRADLEKLGFFEEGVSVPHEFAEPLRG